MMLKYVSCNGCKWDYTKTPTPKCKYCGGHDFTEFDMYIEDVRMTLSEDCE